METRSRHTIMFCGWILPTLGLLLYQTIFKIVVSVKATRILGLVAVGEFIFAICIAAIVIYLLYKIVFLRFIIASLNILVAVFFFIIMVTVNFGGYRLLFGISLWGAIFSIIIVRKESIPYLKQLKIRNPSDRNVFAKKIGKQIGERQWIAMVALGLMIVSAATLATTPIWNLQTKEFTISAAKTQGTDLVFYYASGPGAYSGYRGLIDVAKDYDVTLSLAWHIPYYNETAPGTTGYEMADFIREANSKDVKIEIFPCFHFNWEGILEGHIFTVNNVNMTLNWYEYWSYFTDWLDRENCTVDYVLWDMEGGTSPSDTEEMDYGNPNTQIIGLNQRERELPLIRAEFDRILQETAALNATTRITTWGPEDAMDGDHDKYFFLGQFGYVFEDLIADGIIEYVSTMSYTNGWGNDDPATKSGRQPVYENARMLSMLHPEQVGICIGNINGYGQTTIEEVVNEYHLAIAGGATSVRLFNGASWVLGWDYEVVGPAWGVNGSRNLFEACRQGGTGKYTENAKWIEFIHGSMNMDLMLNLMKI